LFLAISVSYHTFRRYRDAVKKNLEEIRILKARIRAEVDEFEFLSVPELESLCESLCNDLSGNLDAGKIEEKLLKVNNAFAGLYSGMESKHIQDELLQTINRDVRQIEKLANEVTSEMRSYEKLRTEKPYSFVASLFGFSKLPELSVS
jgi:hypothetical protein